MNKFVMMYCNIWTVLESFAPAQGDMHSRRALSIHPAIEWDSACNSNFNGTWQWIKIQENSH